MDFDLVVIGTGTAAMTAAMQVRRAGRSVAIIDEKPFGGTCALRGCDPKKMLIGGVEATYRRWRMRDKGVDGEVRIDWPDLIRFKRSFTNAIPSEHEQRFHDEGIAAFHGSARFSGPNAVAIDRTELTGRHILIASGAAPMRTHIQGAEQLIDHEAFLQLEALPRRIALVGGGYVAAEFSHIAARAGADVTVFQRSSRMLKHFEPELVGWLMEAFERIGVRVMTETVVTAVERSGDHFTVHADSNGKSTQVASDCVVHAAGRAPALDRLDLAAANVAVERGKLKLNDFLQSVSNPAVYAAGDAAQRGPPLTPVSTHDGKVVAANIIDGNCLKPDYRGVPSVAFTLPPIASVGMSEEQARTSGVRFRTKCEQASGWFTARQAAEPVYGYKTLIEEGSGRILGAHLVGPHVDEVINLFGIAIRHGLTADELKSTIFAYPTGASDIGHMV
ncbi:MAG: dihydrolipoyl dehydrogenase family protein [Sphingomicrobium sp.]